MGAVQFFRPEHPSVFNLSHRATPHVYLGST